MKNMIIKLCSVMLVSFLLFSMTSCSLFGFRDEEPDETETSEEAGEEEASEEGEEANAEEENEPDDESDADSEEDNDGTISEIVRDAYIGTWYEETDGIASMSVTDGGNGKLDFEVNWSSSDTEITTWNFTGIPGGRGTIEYSYGIKTTMIFDSDNPAGLVTDQSTTNSGVVRIDEESGKLIWVDNESDKAETVFVRN